MEEVWKEVEGFPGYMVSNLGNARSSSGNILKGCSANGYLRDVPRDAGGVKHYLYRHRAVALAFIPNADGKPCINHIDNNRTNNHVGNLEWCTKQENSDWMVAQGRNKRTAEWIKHLTDTERKRFARAVIGTCIKTGETITFDALNDSRQHGFLPGSVSRCCNGKAYSHHGYTFRFLEGV